MTNAKIRNLVSTNNEHHHTNHHHHEEEEEEQQQQQQQSNSPSNQDNILPIMYSCSLPPPLIIPIPPPDDNDNSEMIQSHNNNLILPVTVGKVTMRLDYELHTSNEIKDATTTTTTTIDTLLPLLKGHMLAYLGETFGMVDDDEDEDEDNDCTGYDVTGGGGGVTERGGEDVIQQHVLTTTSTKIISISSLPGDVLDLDNRCDPSLDPGYISTTCTVIKGYWTASYIGTDENAVIRTIVSQIKQGMTHHAFTDITKTSDIDIVDLTFIGMRSGTTTGQNLYADSSIRSIRNNNDSSTENNDLTAYGTGVVSSASVLFATVGALLYRWKKKKSLRQRIWKEAYNPVIHGSVKNHKHRFILEEEAEQTTRWDTVARNDDDDDSVSEEHLEENPLDIVHDDNDDHHHHHQLEEMHNEVEAAYYRHETRLGIEEGEFMLDHLSRISEASAESLHDIRTYPAESTCHLGEQECVFVGTR